MYSLILMISLIFMVYSFSTRGIKDENKPWYFDCMNYSVVNNFICHRDFYTRINFDNRFICKNVNTAKMKIRWLRGWGRNLYY